MRHKLAILTILSCAVIPVGCQTASNKSAAPLAPPPHPRFYGLELNPAIMVEYGLTTSKRDMYSPALIVAQLEFNGKRITGDAGYTHSDCGIHSGGTLNGTIDNNNHVHLVWNFTQETGPTKAEFDGVEDPSTHEISGKLKFHDVAHVQAMGAGPLAFVDPNASGTFRLIPAGRIQNKALAFRVDEAIQSEYISQAHKHFNNGRSKGFYIDDVKTLNEAAQDYRACIETCALISDEKVRCKELCGAYNNLGVCEQRLGHKEEAAECYDKAIENANLVGANWMNCIKNMIGQIQENQSSLSSQDGKPTKYYGRMLNN